jgi:hypothetical protein
MLSMDIDGLVCVLAKNTSKSKVTNLLINHSFCMLEESCFSTISPSCFLPKAANNFIHNLCNFIRMKNKLLAILYQYIIVIYSLNLIYCQVLQIKYIVKKFSVLHCGIRKRNNNYLARQTSPKNFSSLQQ